MPLPSVPTESPAEAAQVANYAALLAREGVPAIYRARGVGDGAELTTLLSDAERSPIPPLHSGQVQNERREMWLSCFGPRLGIADDVTTYPSVAALQVGDTFEVNGIRAGKPEVASVTLRVVRGSVRFTPPEWTCRVTAG